MQQRNMGVVSSSEKEVDVENLAIEGIRVVADRHERLEDCRQQEFSGEELAILKPNELLYLLSSKKLRAQTRKALCPRDPKWVAESCWAICIANGLIWKRSTQCWQIECLYTDGVLKFTRQVV